MAMKFKWNHRAKTVKFSLFNHFSSHLSLPSNGSSQYTRTTYHARPLDTIYRRCVSNRYGLILFGKIRSMTFNDSIYEIVYYCQLDTLYSGFCSRKIENILKFCIYLNCRNWVLIWLPIKTNIVHAKCIKLTKESVQNCCRQRYIYSSVCYTVDVMYISYRW